jgi:CubicO group peptidase (beta-lactamase class C family)
MNLTLKSLLNFVKYLLILLAFIGLVGCTSVSHVYDFYAHRHLVPMLGKDYVEIPNTSPQNQQLHYEQYQVQAKQAMQAIESHRQQIRTPGISAAVAIDGKLVWAGTSGWADIASLRPLTTETQFRIGSTSKALNAALLAKMVEAGNFSLDTRLSNFEIGKLNDNWADITPRQLASHTAGLPHYEKNNDWSGLLQSVSLKQHFSDVEQSVLLFDKSDMLYSPGETFEYSSLGTILLSAVMQEALKMPYQEAMQSYIFEPLNMTNTSYEKPIEARGNNEQIATFYWHPDYDDNKVAPWREVDLSHRLAAGGFISTSSDLVKLGIGFSASEFLDPNIRDAFWVPQTLNNGLVNEQNYAIGWRVSTNDLGDEVGSVFHANHGGVSRGAQSWLMVIPEHGMAVAVNINAKTDEFWDFASVSYDLVRLFLVE